MAPVNNKTRPHRATHAGNEAARAQGRAYRHPTTSTRHPSNAPPALFCGHKASTRTFPPLRTHLALHPPTVVVSSHWLNVVRELNVHVVAGLRESFTAGVTWYFALERHYTLQIPTNHPTTAAAASHSAFISQPVWPATARLPFSLNHVPTTGLSLSRSIQPPCGPVGFRWGWSEEGTHRPLLRGLHNRTDGAGKQWVDMVKNLCYDFRMKNVLLPLPDDVHQQAKEAAKTSERSLVGWIRWVVQQALKETQE